jgi:hypothetical protein
VRRDRITVLVLVPPKILGVKILDKDKYYPLMLLVLEKAGNCRR